MSISVHPNAPDWFREAVATPQTDYFIDVNGSKIHYVRWLDDNSANKNPTDKPGLLFVHGGGAHSHWWDFIAPSFMDKYSVAAIDIFGMGDSDHLDEYLLSDHADAMIAVSDACGFGDDKIIVSHSFGGFCTLKTASLYADQLKGVVIVDTVLSPQFLNQEKDQKEGGFKPRKVYPSMDDAMLRFKLLPAQPCENDYILDYIGRHSLMEVEDGVMWKFDHMFGPKTDTRELKKDIPGIKCNTTVMHGEQSLFFKPDSIEFMRGLYGAHVPFVSVPNSQHHVFLDQPVEFTKALKGVLNQWD
ncbi:MAG: alpha/beta hydrolase [Pseudomonadales bacterium]|nr:alpha/beta hydrolase [Pseudomonadales bacterium]